MSNPTTTIYVLALEEGKYYVGKSNEDNISTRLKAHKSGNGSAWTKKYPPIDLVQLIESASPFEEDRVTKEYMCYYGIKNVRGGSYVKVTLSAEEEKFLQTEMRGAQNQCLRCGRSDHFVARCYAVTDIDGASLSRKGRGTSSSSIRSSSFTTTTSSSTIAIPSSSTPSSTPSSSTIATSSSSSTTTPSFFYPCPGTPLPPSFTCSYCSSGKVFTSRYECDTHEQTCMHSRSFSLGSFSSSSFTSTSISTSTIAGSGDGGGGGGGVHEYDDLDHEDEWSRTSLLSSSPPTLKTAKADVGISDSGKGCSRCGRKNHRRYQCYAKTHVKGGQLTPTNTLSEG